MFFILSDRSYRSRVRVGRASDIKGQPSIWAGAVMQRTLNTPKKHGPTRMGLSANIEVRSFEIGHSDKWTGANRELRT